MPKYTDFYIHNMDTVHFSGDLDTSVWLVTVHELRISVYFINISREIEAETVNNVSGALQKGAEWEEGHRDSFLLSSYKVA